MAGNFGKFIDRSPIICAAGKPLGTPGGDTVASTLKEYNVEDKISAIKHDAGIWSENVFEPPLKLPPAENPQFRGTNTEIKPLLNPAVKTRYQTLIQELTETPYDSYWNKNLGKCRYQVPGLPSGMSVTEVTFGIPTVKGPTMKELVNPPKTPYQVLSESQIGHEMYKKTHNDYNPSEHIQRGYISPPFDKDRCYGYRSKFDPRGIWVRCACDWHIQEPVVHANRIQADHLDRVKPQLGKVLAPNKNIECVPKDHSFGDPTKRASFGMEELLKDPGLEPCLFKRDFYTWLASLNRFKLKMKQRSKQDFSFGDFYKACVYWDKEKTGLLPLTIFYDLCVCDRITYHKDDIESLLKVLNILRVDKIDYRKFIDLVDTDTSVPKVQLKSFEDIPKQHLYYVTTSQAACCDYLTIDNSALPAAGAMPTQSTFGDGTTVNSLINPSIYSNYGLSYRDFFLPRSKGTLRNLFEKIGYCFADDAFERLWQAALDQDGTGSVCVNTFKGLVEAQFTQRRLRVDEADYCK